MGKSGLASALHTEIKDDPLPFFTTSGPVLTWIFDRIGVAGLTTPWRTVYLHPDHWDIIENIWLWRHEHCHIDQINRDGPWLWSFRVVWYCLRYGYHNSPYEVEARAAEEGEHP